MERELENLDDKRVIVPRERGRMNKQFINLIGTCFRAKMLNVWAPAQHVLTQTETGV